MNSTLPTKTFPPRRLSTWNITTRFRLLPWKSNTPRRQRSANRIPMRPRPRISRRITTQRKTILPAAAMIVPDRILAVVGIAAPTVGEIAAAVDVGDALADAIAADAHKVVPEGAICLPRNTRRRKAATLADMTIVVGSLAVTTIGVRRLRAIRRLP